MRLPVAATTAAACLLVAAGPAAAAIVPQRSIRGVRVGESAAQVRATLGVPDKVITRRSDILGRYREYRYGRTRVSFDGLVRRSRVTTISTTSRSQRTAAGIGVGSSRAQVRHRVKGVHCRVEGGRDHCFIGRFLPGHRVTDFALGRHRHVIRVTIGTVLD